LCKYTWNCNRKEPDHLKLSLTKMNALAAVRLMAHSDDDDDDEDANNHEGDNYFWM